MISTFNLIVRRGHVPREQALVRLMSAVGLTVEPNVGTAADDGVDHGDEDMLSDGSGECEGVNEGGESECSCTEDEPVHCDEEGDGNFTSYN